MKDYEFRATFVTSLLMHRDNILGADQVKNWREKNKKAADSVKGDDRWPIWTWKTYLYHDEGKVVVPGENLTSMCSVGGTSIRVGRGSLKKQAVSEILWEMSYPLMVDGKEIKMTDIDHIEGSFENHEKLVKEMGFLLHARRVRVGTSKHIRIRPQFPPGCYFEGTFTVRNQNILGESVLKDLFENCGQNVGIGDWRPGAGKPGRHGMFMIDFKEKK